MKTARATAHDNPNVMCDWTPEYVDAPHHWRCDMVTAAIEDDRRELVEAAIKLARRYEGGEILESELRALAPRLIPKEDSRG